MRTIITITLLALSVALCADYLVLNSESQYLSLVNGIDWSITDDPTQLGQFPYAAPNRIAIEGDIAWVTVTYENTLQGVSLRDGNARSTIYLADSAGPYDVLIDDGTAYVSGGTSNTLYRVNLADEQVTGELPMGVYPEGLALHEGMLYVCNSGFHFDTYSYDPGTVSVVDLASFAVVDTLHCATNPQEALVVGNELHVACSGDLFNIAGQVDVFGLPGHELLSSVETGGTPGRLSATDGVVYAANAYPAGVTTYSIDTHEVFTTPDNSPYTGGTDALAHNGNLLVLDAVDYIENSHLRVYRLADNMLLRDTELGVGALDVKYWDNGVSVDEEEDTPASGIAVQAWPNPVRQGCRVSFAPAAGKRGEVEVFNVRGQRVRTLSLVDGQAWWDGHDLNGRACTSGVYLLRVSSEGQTQTKRVTLLR